jgi:heterodisulfide reductase subunit C/quinone-modifying oxidoreductase subunit QmoC
MAISEGHYKDSSAANVPDFSGTFIDYVESYGRSFEVGLATRYHLSHHPLDVMKMAQLGLGMWRRGRVDFTPNRIRNIDQLKAILKKAKEIGEAA